MSKNPFINALAATVYIVLVALVMRYGSQFAQPEDTVFAPIAFISLFTLSAAVMGYLFVYQPLQVYMEGDKKGAVTLFLQTTGIFAVITIVALLIAFVK
jgi:hypothetical protein